MIIFTNETNKDASISANSVNTNYPLSNLVDSRLSRLFRNSSTTANIVFDNVTATTVDAVAIANHNISNTATIKLQGNDTASWTSPSVDETLTYNDNIIYKVITSASHRYWRISITDTSNPDGYIEIGRAWIGQKLTTPGIAPTVTQNIVDESIKSQSISGQTYGDTRFFRSFFITNYPAVTHAEKASLTAEFLRVGKTTPFFQIFDEECSDLDSYYVTLDQDSFRFTTLSNPAYYSVGFNTIEEI